MKAKKSDYLLIKIVVAVILGIIIGFIIKSTSSVSVDGSMSTQHILMNIVLPIKHILGQVIFFMVPLIIIGFVTPAITGIKNNTSKMLGTMSSAATLPVALKCAGKSDALDKDVVDFAIPMGATIHLCGSVLTETFFVMGISYILYGSLPDFTAHCQTLLQCLFLLCF